VLKIKNIYFPSNMREAITMLKKKKSIFIAGSTFSFKALPQDIEDVVLSKKIKLNYIKKDSKNLVIGSLATFNDIENDKYCKTLFGGSLSMSASQCSSQLIRNMATIGGNIAHTNAFNIWPVMLTMLNSKVKIITLKGEKTALYKDLYKLGFIFGRNALIKEIMIPLEYSKDNFYFHKVSKIKSSWDSYLTAAFRSKIKEGKIKDIKLVFGAIRALPYENIEIEKGLLNHEITDDLIKETAERYSSGILSINPNAKINKYRSQLAGNLVSYYLNYIRR